MKEKIFALRRENKTYREIGKVLGCSRSLISYYLNPNGKQNKNDRQNKNRFRRRGYYKKLLGNKCSRCEYDKCLDSLHFHHKDPSTKLFTISDAIWNKKHNQFSEDEILAEVKKCELVCANCHGEIHTKNNFS